MKNKIKNPHVKNKKHDEYNVKDDLLELCLRKGLIEKTEYGYYFKPEFFETLEIYDEE